MQSEPEFFMDVQDLILQWIFLRSFEMRPQLTTFYIQFLVELMTKYSGANLLSDQERTLVVTSCFQLFISCGKYVDASYFLNLVGLIAANGGWTTFFTVLQWNLTENQIIERFHLGDIIDLAFLGVKFIPGTHIGQLAVLAKALIDRCHSNSKPAPELLKKCIELLAQLYVLNPDVIESYFTDPQDEAIVAIRHVAERGGIQGLEFNTTSSPSEPVAPAPAAKGARTAAAPRATRNEIIEVPHMSPEETDYEDPEEAAHQHNGDPTEMALRGQMESFLNTFQQSDEPTASHYLDVLAQWLQDPGMLELVVENANPLVENLIRYLQQVCGGVDPSRLKIYLQLVEGLEKISNIEQALKVLTEPTVFEMLDTLLYVLIIINDYKAKFVEKSAEFQGMTKMVTTLNATVLKVISHGDCNVVYSTLFELLIKSRMEPVPEKFDGLVSKCIVKITQRIEGITDQIDIEAIILKMHLYLTTLTSQNIEKKDDVGVKIVKTALIALLNKYDDDVVLTAYRNVYRGRGMAEEPNLSKWLKQLIKNKTRDQTFVAPVELRASNVPNKSQPAQTNTQRPPATAVVPGRRTEGPAPTQFGRKASGLQEAPQQNEEKRRAPANIPQEPAPQQQVRSRNKSPLNKQALDEYYAEQDEPTRQYGQPSDSQFEDDKENLSAEIMGVIDKLRVAAMAEIPKYLRQLTTVLDKDAEELDISPLIADLDSKLRGIVVKHVDGVYNKRREGAQTPAEMSQSNYESVNQSFRDPGMSASKGAGKLQSLRESRMMARGGLSSNNQSQKQMAPLSQTMGARPGSIRPLEETSMNKLQEAQRRFAQGANQSRNN